jgi:hypothetical protein
VILRHLVGGTTDEALDDAVVEIGTARQRIGLLSAARGPDTKDDNDDAERQDDRAHG